MAKQFEGGSDPNKDKVEKSSQVDDIDTMLDNQLDLTEDEQALDPDREGLDVRAQKTADLHDKQDDTKQRREPDVQVRDQQSDSDVEDTTPLGKALKTIETLTGKVGDLETRLSSGQQDTRQRQTEPQIEMIEILPNIRLPKDSSRWPIKVTDADLIKLGWNDEAKGPAAVLNILGNALYMFAAETIPEFAGQAFETRLTQRETASKVQESFEGMYPHLKKHRDIVSLVERNERQNPSSSLRGKYGNDYYQALGQLGEAKIADIRGITVEQYRAEVATQRGRSNQNSNEQRPRSRAVTTGGSTRSASPVPKSDFERDSEDL